MEGGFFDSIWDPYAYYPRSRYYRPVYDHYGDRSPLNQKIVKTVKTIPVTDGSAPMFKSEDAAATKLQAVYRGYVVRKTQPLQHLRVIKKVKEELESLKVKLLETEQKKLSGDAKERLRWTEGVMALLLRLDSLQGVHSEVRLVRKAVTKELLGFQDTIDSMSNGQDDVIIRSEDTGTSNSTAFDGMEIEEGAAEELSEDQGSDGHQGSNVHQDIKSIGDSTHVPNAHSAIDDRVLDSVALHCDDQNGSLCGLVGEAAVVVSEPSSPEAPMDVENKEQLSMISPAHLMEEGEVEPASQNMYQDFARGGAIEDGCNGQGIKVIEDSTSEKHVPHANSAVDDRVTDLVAPHCDDQNGSLCGLVGEAAVVVSEPSSPEAPMDVENKEQLSMISPAHVMEEGEVELASQNMYQDFARGGAIEDGCNGQGIKVIEDSTSEKHVPHANSAVDDRVIDSVAPHCDDQNGLLVGEIMVEEGLVSEPCSSEARAEALEGKKQILMMAPAHRMEEDGVETTSSQILPPETDNQEADTSAVADKVRREEADMDMSQSDANVVFAAKETTGAGSTDRGDGSIIPSNNSVQSQSLQGGQGDNMNALSDRALLLQVLEENRKLKDVLGKVLQWGKQQSDAIHDLTHRIAQLEEHQPPSKLLHGEDNNGRRRVISPVDNRGRSRRRLEKDRRNRCRLGYVDSEDWLSADSDEYF